MLRIETTANDVSFFKHHRKVEHRAWTGNPRPGAGQEADLPPDRSPQFCLAATNAISRIFPPWMIFPLACGRWTG